MFLKFSLKMDVQVRPPHNSKFKLIFWFYTVLVFWTSTFLYLLPNSSYENWVWENTELYIFVPMRASQGHHMLSKSQVWYLFFYII